MPRGTSVRSLRKESHDDVRSRGLLLCQNRRKLTRDKSTAVSTAMPVSKRDEHYHTYADYLRWSNTYGDELIDGTAYVREPPSPSRSHQKIVGEIFKQLDIALENRSCEVYVTPFDVRLPKSTEEDDQIDTVVQPDVLIVSDLQKLDARGVRGAPDWLAEEIGRAHV